MVPDITSSYLTITKKLWCIHQPPGEISTFQYYPKSCALQGGHSLETAKTGFNKLS